MQNLWLNSNKQVGREKWITRDQRVLTWGWSKEERGWGGILRLAWLSGYRVGKTNT